MSSFDVIDELVIVDRLRDLLPPLTEEQSAGLEADIRELGRVTDPIQYWEHNGDKVVVDGMNRLGIVRKLRDEDFNVAVSAESLLFDDIDDVEYWMLKRQASRRNLSTRQLQEIWGKLYNHEKIGRGTLGETDRKNVHRSSSGTLAVSIQSAPSAA